MDLFSPPEFRRWAAISTVAGVLERRVWTPSRATRPTYPNLYVCLTGISGSGKTEAINIARALWAQLDKFILAPDNLTPAAFYDALFGSLKVQANGNSNGNGILQDMCSPITVCNRELGVLFPAYDRGWLSDLSDLWDNQDFWKSARRVSTTVEIERPTVNILSAVTPKYLGDVMPEIAWGQGFAARMLYIYGHREVNGVKGIDVLKPLNKTDLTTLSNILKSIYLLEGEYNWTPKAHDEINVWFEAGLPPIPQHTRLVEYRTRRLQHAMKLSMISAASNGHGLDIKLEDFERAVSWLTSAEDQMPNVFRSMSAKSDSQTINDMHYHFWTKYASVKREDRKPIPTNDFHVWLYDRVESHRIQSVINTAERVGAIKRSFIPDEWEPQPFDKQISV